MTQDFEDRLPCPPMGLGGRVVIGVLVALQGYGLYAQGLMVWGLAADLMGLC